SNSLLDKVEVQNEVQRCDDNDDQGEANAHWTGLVDKRQACSEPGHDDVYQVHQADGTRGGDQADLEFLRRPNHARAIDEEHDRQDPDTQAHRLNHVPGYNVSKMAEIAPRSSPSKAA